MFDFLRKIPLFADLPDEDLKHLCRLVEEVRISAGEELFAEGSPGDRAYVIRSGELEILKRSGGREVLLAVRKGGEVIGEMALQEESPRTATVRARTDGVLLAIDKEQLDRLLSNSVSAARAMFYTSLRRLRETEAMLRQSEKMAQLGTLTAGVAHELNNSAAAVKRGADQLLDAVSEYLKAQSQLGVCAFSGTQQNTLKDLTRHAKDQAGRPPELDTLARSDREHDLEDWLEERGVTDGWELTPALVDLDYDTEKLAGLAERFAAENLPAVISWLNATYTVHILLTEIGQGAGRISEIVKALKSYSYLDQAPVQTIDVHEGLDNTLMILRNKLRNGISVRREYAPDLPKIQAYGSELNQVWTNFIDNAADALEEQGQITIRTRPEREGVMVEIEDNGPGIPPEVQPRIFDSFFTTKPPGQGTGLGLDISYNIVANKHRGDIKVLSEPGSTRFQVWLPVNFEAR